MGETLADHAARMYLRELDELVLGPPAGAGRQLLRPGVAVTHERETTELPFAFAHPDA